MILGASTYVRIWGLDWDPDVSSGFANGKVLFVGSACKSICKCKSSFHTDQGFVLFFFRSSKNPWAKQNADGMYMWHFCGFLATCFVCIQIVAGEDRMQWHISGVLRRPAAIWGASISHGSSKHLFFFFIPTWMTWSTPSFCCDCCDPFMHWFYLASFHLSKAKSPSLSYMLSLFNKCPSSRSLS